MNTRENGQKWPSRGYKTLSWTSKLLLAPTLILSLFFLIRGLVTSISNWSHWSGTEWSALGAWAGAAAAAFLASVSVWQTHRANEQARSAEKLALRDIEERQLGDIRNREYQATELVMKGISALVSEVYSYKEYADGQPTLNFTKLSEPAPEGPLLRRRELLRSCNESATQVRLALMQISHPALQNEARKVMGKVVAAVSIIFSKEGKNMDIDAAVEAADAANEAGLDFQVAADTRFHNPDQFVGLEFPQMSITESGS